MRLHQISLLIAFLFLSVGSVGVVGQEYCSSSCGQLKNISYPFRLKDDPATCGNRSYELTCNGNKAIMNFHSGMYYVESIFYANTTIRVIDVGLASGGCALPARTLSPSDLNMSDALYAPGDLAASFVNCTQKIQNSIYTPIPCLSEKSGFVYVVFRDSVSDLPPSCKFLAMVPSMSDGMAGTNESQVFKLLQEGFTLQWGTGGCSSASFYINNCIVETRKELRNDLKHKILFYRIVSPLAFQKNFFNCLDSYASSYIPEDLPGCSSYIATFRLVKVLNVLLDVAAFLFLAVLVCRFLFVPLSVCLFLAYKYWEMQVPLDAVEKFLRIQQSLTPTRYSYTDIVAMTRNFKVKLGKGGFGSVYKGELPGGFQVAVKILENARCNGDDFISEVSTIGRIHHINIVRLIGYSSDGSNRALIYEYLSKGSLDKYIFSSDRTSQRPFTWNKLIDIALGVARGIDYYGCEIKPILLSFMDLRSTR